MCFVVFSCECEIRGGVMEVGMWVILGGFLGVLGLGVCCWVGCEGAWFPFFQCFPGLFHACAICESGNGWFVVVCVRPDGCDCGDFAEETGWCLGCDVGCLS